MGHTVWSSRQNLDILLDELSSYGKALRQEDREIFVRLLKVPLQHVGSISYVSSLHEWAFLLLSIMLEQEKRLRKLEETYGRVVNGCVQERQLDNTVD